MASPGLAIPRFLNAVAVGELIDTILAVSVAETVFAALPVPVYPAVPAASVGPDPPMSEAAADVLPSMTDGMKR